MRKKIVPLILFFMLFTSFPSVKADAVAPTFRIMTQSDSGDYIGQNKLWDFSSSNNSKITVTQASNGLANFYVNNFTVSNMSFGFASEAGKTLAPGLYTPAKRLPFRDSFNGIEVSGDGRGCNTILGAFYVHEYIMATGTLQKAAIDFVQICEPQSSDINAVKPKLYGSLRYNSTVPDSCDSNGCAAAKKNVGIIDAVAKPDLTVKDIYIENNLIKAKYCNNGSNPIDVNAFGIQTFYIKVSANGKIHTGTSNSSNYIFQVPDAGQCAYTDGLPVDYFGLTEGNSYSVTAVIDHLNTVDESNETNNTLTKTVTVSRPAADLIITAGTGGISSDGLASIYWTTNVQAICSVAYSGNSDLSGSTNGTGTLIQYALPTNDNLYHYAVSPRFSGLKTDGTNYYYKVSCHTTNGPTVTSPINILTSNEAATNLTVSNISTSVTETGATITWTSSAAGDSQIRYAEDLASLPNQEWQVKEFYDSGKVNHTAVLTGLKANTTYVFEVRTTNASVGEAVAGSGHFTTQANQNIKVITAKNITTRPVTDTSINIIWDTGYTGNTKFYYREGGGIDDQNTKSVEANCYNKSFSTLRECQLVLTGLTPGGVYFYKFQEGDITGVYGSYFVMPTKFNNSEITIKNITDSSAAIIWNTDKALNGKILYYPAANIFDQKTAFDQNFANSHNIKLDNLKPATQYTLKVTSLDQEGGGKISENLSFTTLNNSGYQPSPADNQNSDTSLSDIQNAAKNIVDNKYDAILAELKLLRDAFKEQQTEIKYLKSLTADLKNVSDQMQSAINDFITYGVDPNTVKLGAGERAAVINSYQAAFDKLPQTEAELTDVIKIANGRFPSIVSDTAEQSAKDQFAKIYKRLPDMNGAKDAAAVEIMAYGLRQKAANRNLNSEKAGIKIFKAIYGHTPQTTAEWNAMQAITYSGASQKTWLGYNPGVSNR